ncbi:solute:sodium symporter family transporter [Bacillus hwajinpoensis]|uniref:Solute:sodium symporter family transporter n=1 Tax=Guptibacillus hwajinpoensis TaxID=208199 RepID=A0A845F0L0_9BACL|nr:solute:sodium symporter family transporter [Pseudalkalibacillus hwajinpoensis]MYL64319.1 solute:sodium symporter family transporter [Pseudalkalibacillus hwajinpoensis]
MQSLWFTLLSCVAFMVLVGYIAYRKTRGTTSGSDGYFLAGRGLSGGFIAGSLLLTNLSAEQLVGLNGQAFRTNLSNMAWEVTAGVAVVLMGLYLLPKYLNMSITTLPEFLSKRFDEGVRRYTVVLFMVGYVLVTIPSMLYSGALAVLKLFDVPSILNISYTQSIWVVIWGIGIIGAVYAIFGGLKAVAVSDTINGVGLLIVGALVPILGLIALGDGAFLDGVKTITTTNPEKLNAIGGPEDSVPFGTIFTGLIIANMFYWATNQYVIQRTLGAKNLKEGQKGVIFSGFFKLLIPIFMMVPGVIAFHLYGGDLKSVDLAYPTLVMNVLPSYLSGFFLAVLLGAVLSSYNSLLNSASTMFALDIYKPAMKKDATDEQLITASKWFGSVIAIVTFFVSPMLMYAPNGLWDLIRKFTGFFNIPIVAVVLIGILSKKVPALAAKAAIIFHVVAYYMMVWGTEQIFELPLNIHFIHIYGILFVAEVAIMFGIAYWKPQEKAYVFPKASKVNMTPWKYSVPAGILLIASICETYLVFSPIGVAYAGGMISPSFLPATGALAVVTLIAFAAATKSWERKYGHTIRRAQNAVKETSREVGGQTQNPQVNYFTKKDL